jgi:hypothetical protein
MSSLDTDTDLSDPPSDLDLEYISFHTLMGMARSRSIISDSSDSSSNDNMIKKTLTLKFQKKTTRVLRQRNKLDTQCIEVSLHFRFCNLRFWWPPVPSPSCSLNGKFINFSSTA